MKLATRMTSTAAALAIALGSAGAYAANGISIDENGAAPGGGTKNITVFDDKPGNLVAQNVLDMPQGASPNDPYILGQTHFTTNVPGWIVTYQFKIPVTSSLVPNPPPLGGFTPTLTNDTSRVAEFGIWLDMDNADGLAADANSGDGFGTLNGASDNGSGLILLASGSAAGATGGARLSSSASDPTGSMTFSQSSATLSALAENRDGVASGHGVEDDVLTTAMNGSGSVRFYVDFQNTDYVLNDLIGSAIDVDFALLSLGPVAPYDPGALASRRVVGVDTEAAGFYGYGSNDDINDFTCGDPVLDNPAGDPCSMQFQTSVTMVVRAETVPEPGSLALLGVGMGLLGMVPAIRRRKSA